MSIRRDTPSHAPSDRPGACDPCAHGDHGGCDAVVTDQYTPVDCTCYDDAWEWHEEHGDRVTRPAPARRAS